MRSFLAETCPNAFGGIKCRDEANVDVKDLRRIIRKVRRTPEKGGDEIVARTGMLRKMG